MTDKDFRHHCSSKSNARSPTACANRSLLLSPTNWHITMNMHWNFSCRSCKRPSVKSRRLRLFRSSRRFLRTVCAIRKSGSRSRRFFRPAKARRHRQNVLRRGRCGTRPHRHALFGDSAPPTDFSFHRCMQTDLEMLKHVENRDRKNSPSSSRRKTISAVSRASRRFTPCCV